MAQHTLTKVTGLAVASEEVSALQLSSRGKCLKGQHNLSRRFVRQ